MQVVIIGNSAAGLSGLEAFRKKDQSSSVTIVAKEGEVPYSKVLLPYYLLGKIPYANLFTRDKNYYARLNAKCIKGNVVKLLPEQQAVLLESGTLLPYDKLLIATGSSPVKPPIPGLSGNGIYHLWTLADVENLAPYYNKGKRVVVLGSGFVSLQGAWAALSRGLDVSVIELMDRIMPRVLDDHAAALLTARMIKSGVDLRINTFTREIERTGDGKLVLHFKNGKSLTSDFIIVGTGIRPNIEFTAGTGIKIDAGIVVNKQMETTLPGVYAAGDVAQVPSASGGDPVVHALWPTAIETGCVAGTCMALGKSNYRGSLNMNVTQMFDITVASMGEFTEIEGSESWIDENLPEDQYLKIVLKDGIPIGAICAGGSELISTLGMLRPLIREKVSLQGKPGMFKAILARNIAQHQQAFVK
jgi:nitrite reductase (NADH) large subunit